MKMKKWLMKQQWRIVQIRGIWGLFYSILILAYAYFAYIPFFADLGLWGPFAFSGVILFVFLILGYIYDRVLVMWAPALEVTMERNPYQYVPSPKDHIFWFPIYSTLLDSIEKLADNVGADKTAVKDAQEYFTELQILKPDRKKDLDKGKKLREKFHRNHSFTSDREV